MNSPVILLGYMGCGKTKIGRRLSQKLNLNFIDLDHEIELFYSKTITELFEDLGEVRFREIEREILIKILDNKNRFVLSLQLDAMLVFLVIPLGLEPRTLSLKGRCSTN